MKNYRKGFTLVEILVVIAIIGILASITIASLNTARNKAKDAAVKEMVNSMRTQAEFGYNSSTGGYNGLCLDPVIVNLEQKIDLETGHPGQATCSSSNTKWIVKAQLVDNTYWCADSTGFSGPLAVAPVGMVCNP